MGIVAKPAGSVVIGDPESPVSAYRIDLKVIPAGVVRSDLPDPLPARGVVYVAHRGMRNFKPAWLDVGTFQGTPAELRTMAAAIESLADTVEREG